MEANCAWNESNLLQNWSRCHAPDWETYGRQVEVSTHDCTTDLSNNTFDGTSKIVLSFNVVEREAAIFVGIWASILVINLQRLEVFGPIDEVLDIVAQPAPLLRFVWSVFIGSQHLLYYLLLLILRQIVFEWEVLTRLQVVQRVDQVERSRVTNNADIIHITVVVVVAIGCIVVIAVVVQE